MANLRNCASTYLAALAITLGITSPASANTLCPIANCLAAHDINGIALGMTIQQLNKLFDGNLTDIGGGQFEGSKDGVNYDFGFTVLGRLYRIYSSQELGMFEPTSAIAKTLTDKLTAKYGAPEFNQLPGGTASWDYIENVSGNTTPYNRFTETLTASFVEHYQAPTTLDLKLMDFRMLRQDAARRNEQPARDASSQIRF